MARSNHTLTTLTEEMSLKSLNEKLRLFIEACGQERDLIELFFDMNPEQVKTLNIEALKATGVEPAVIHVTRRPAEFSPMRTSTCSPSVNWPSGMRPLKSGRGRIGTNRDGAIDPALRTKKWESTHRRLAHSPAIHKAAGTSSVSCNRGHNPTPSNGTTGMTAE